MKQNNIGQKNLLIKLNSIFMGNLVTVLILVVGLVMSFVVGGRSWS